MGWWCPNCKKNVCWCSPDCPKCGYPRPPQEGENKQ